MCQSDGWESWDKLRIHPYVINIREWALIIPASSNLLASLIVIYIYQF